MIIKSIYNKINLHPLFLFVAASALFTGLFKEFVIMFTIIIIHEIGHYLAAKHYNFGICRLNLYPFGGYIEFDDKINRPLKEDFIVLISGPIMQTLFFLLVVIMYKLNILNNITYNMVYNYHCSLLIFNMLPIFPLDGSKLLNIILSRYFPFKFSHLCMIYMSYIMLVGSLFMIKSITININMYLLFVLLFTRLVKEGKNHHALYNRFLLERYLYNFNFNKIKIIKGERLDRMMRDKKHFFLVKKQELTEKMILKKRYQSK